MIGHLFATGTRSSASAFLFTLLFSQWSPDVPTPRARSSLGVVEVSVATGAWIRIIVPSLTTNYLQSPRLSNQESQNLLQILSVPWTTATLPLSRPDCGDLASAMPLRTHTRRSSIPILEFERDEHRDNTAQMQAQLAESIVQGLSKPCPKESEPFAFTKTIPTIVLYDEKGSVAFQWRCLERLWLMDCNNGQDCRSTLASPRNLIIT